MSDLRRIFLVPLVALPLVAGCRTTAPAAVPAPAVTPDADARLAGVLWLQTSAEYQSIARASYSAARRALDRALADPAWSAALEQTGDAAGLPPAVIADVDETLLDNSVFEAESILARRPYESARWRAWVERRAATAVPGAVEFARYAAERGVTVFYVTNRAAELETATRDNLARVGFPLPEGVDTLLAPGERPEWTSDKASRRAEVSKSYRVLLLLGDDLNDFVSGAWDSPADRRALAARYDERWGERWILLPNPYYGSWERALYGHDRKLSEVEKLQRKLEQLRTEK